MGTEMVAGLVLWKPTWPVMSLWRHSLFLAVKYAMNLQMVLLAARCTCQKLHAMVKTPVDLSRMIVRLIRATLTMGSPPMAAMHWTSQSHSQRDSMGSVGDHRVAMLAQLASSSS